MLNCTRSDGYRRHSRKGHLTRIVKSWNERKEIHLHFMIQKQIKPKLLVKQSLNISELIKGMLLLPLTHPLCQCNYLITQPLHNSGITLLNSNRHGLAKLPSINARLHCTHRTRAPIRSGIHSQRLVTPRHTLTGGGGLPPTGIEFPVLPLTSITTTKPQLT